MNKRRKMKMQAGVEGKKDKRGVDKERKKKVKRRNSNNVNEENGKKKMVRRMKSLILL